MKREPLSRRRFLAGAGAVAAAAGLARAEPTAADTVPPAPGRPAPAPGPASGEGRAAPPRRALRVGVTAMQTASWDDIASFWDEAEELGFDTAFVYDHLMAAVPGPPDTERCHEAWTLLAALAARTDRIRLGVLVTANSLRNPALLAKMACTVDHVSHGRLILGIGTGWLEREHAAYGVAFPPAPERARRLVEAVDVIRSLFTLERATVAGRYYSLHDAPLEPKPLQKPHPPLLIGGMGPKVVQPLAARHAQIWHFGVPGGDPTVARRTVAAFEETCRRVGRDPAAVERATSVDPRVATAPATELLANLRALADAGIGHFTLLPSAGNDRTTMRRLAKEVLPALRAG